MSGGSSPGALWRAVEPLPLRVEGYSLERRSLDVSSGFTRVTTTVRLAGADALGQGEDVAYDAEDHDHVPANLSLGGEWTVGSFSEHLETLDLFPRAPVREAARDYRRWAFESAALDLALRQLRRSLGEVLGRPYRPVRFVISTRLEIEGWLEIDPTLEFKLDPTPEWSAERIAAAAAGGRVLALDFKGYYSGTLVDVETDPELYRRVVEAFPEAVLEDPAWTEETARILSPHQDRLAWDAPVHCVDDLDRLPLPPRWVNVKPSRFATVRRLFDAYEACAERGIRTYGGGQFELGPGRRQIQALASLFHPDTPNDVAPSGYNAPAPTAGLPPSPLIPPEPPAPGFGFGPEPDRSEDR